MKKRDYEWTIMESPLTGILLGWAMTLALFGILAWWTA